MTELVADAMVARLRAWGTTRVFGYAGDGVNTLLGALARAGDPEFVSTRHEELAAFAACGHAKYSGEVGVCLATQGPGAIHLLAGLYDAKLDRRPVVAIVGQVVSTALGSGYLQEVDLHALFKDVCAQYVQTVFAPEQLPMALDNAMRTALATSTPTCLIVPHDVQKAEMPDELEHSHGVVPSAAVYTRAHVVARDADVGRAADLLNDGEKIAVLVGRGGRGAEDELTRIVELLGAGVATSLLGKPVLDESAPWHTGVMGHLGTTASAQLMADCDTLLIVGSNDPWTEFYPAPGQARAVQIDVEPRVVGAKYPVDVALTGDAADTLSRLAPLLRRKTDRSWQQQVEGWTQDWHRESEERAEAQSDLANPEFVVRTLSEHLPGHSRVAVDVGSATYWYARHLRLPPGVPAHVSGYLASMGCALPYGIAAKLDAPERPVVALVGDGAMQMSGLLELVTIADRWRDWTDPRFVILVLHNQDLTEVSWEQREMEGDARFPDSQHVPAFPYADYAELLGLQGLRVVESEQAPAAWSKAFAADRPTLIEAIVDPKTPLLPPLMPEAKADKVYAALAGEPDGAVTWERVAVQRKPPSP
ncbi:thiamine pyrophosphate-requiring protein [Mycolicibacterium novocastrense]|uniref:Thiamine pyrophosphate binding domain-containing protein n=1 Tax=Mycolicibacterium novocastrense TaxID=59813 RepID=A0AAW5SNU7_MYCNV|nr:thiamine pyrophosphate-requiring protein [Mycolicibacterium novocastrense]MCV7024742.1 thiamine pyrophosphate-requiring protein [Mycolicibacterium novocastrense]GAT12127.1 thiamine pyrophosphate binding domain-containing protein [Mycolicibacterium novocastrense]